MAQILTPICHDAWARQRQTPLIAQRDTMKQPWREPTLDDLLSPSYSPNLDDFRAWATLFGGTRGTRRRTRSGSALMFLFGWQALGVTRQGWDAATSPRGSRSGGGEAASEQLEQPGVGACRRQTDADAGRAFDDARGDLDQTQAQVLNSAVAAASASGRRRAWSAGANRRRCAGSGGTGWLWDRGTRCGRRRAGSCAA